MFDLYCIHECGNVEVIAIREYDWVDFYHTSFTSSRGIAGTAVMEIHDNYTFTTIANGNGIDFETLIINDQKIGWDEKRQEFHYSELTEYLNSEAFMKEKAKRFWLQPGE